MYLGFNYDLARGMQDELLRWAEEQRKIKRVRSRKPVEAFLPRSEPEEDFRPRSKVEDVQPIGEEALEERRAS